MNENKSNATPVGHIGRRDREMTGWFQEDTGEIAPGVCVSPGMNVVDVGCGDGTFISFCNQLGADTTFIDLKEERVRALEQRLRKEANGGRVEGIVSDCKPIPLETGFADLVISTEVLEHVIDPRQFLCEIVRIGKPGATYCITVPHSRSENLLRDIAPPMYFAAPNHINVFSPEDFQALASECGLEVLRHEFICGFWSIFSLLKWATIEPGESLTEVAHPAVYHWTRAWEEILDHPKADKVRSALNAALPRVQVIIARRCGDGI